MQRFEQDDQAMGLRRISGGRPVKVVAVTSGKGGVGKTNVSVNLAVAMAQRGQSTLLLDADLGLANVDVLLGLHPVANLAAVMRGELALEDIVLEGPAGVKIIPAASGLTEMVDLGARAHNGLISAFAGLPFAIDNLVVDTAAGIDSGVLDFCQAAHEVVVVVCDEPASITDAYAVIKVLSRQRDIRRFQVLCNKVESTDRGWELYRKLLAVCDRFLDVTLSHCANIPYDAVLRKAVRMQRAVVDSFPSSPSGIAFKELARRADTWKVPMESSGRPAFFHERSAGPIVQAVGAE